MIGIDDEGTLEELMRQTAQELAINRPFEEFIKAVSNLYVRTQMHEALGDNLKETTHVPNLGKREVRITSFCEKIVEISNMNLKDWGYGCLTNYLGELYLYHQTHFIKLDRAMLNQLIRKVGALFGLAPDDYYCSEFADKCEKQLLYSAAAPKLPPDDRCFVNFQNGSYEFTLNGTSRKEYGGKPKYFFQYSLPFYYDPKAKCPLTDGFLFEVLEEQECIDVVFEFIGYPFCTINEVRQISLEKMPVFYGSGANGKSVLHNTAIELYGKDNVSHYSPHDISSSMFTRHALNGKLVNWCSDARSSMQSDTMKQIISREPVAAQIKYGRHYTIDLPPAIMINTNELPSAKDFSDGWFRRLDIIKFEKTIPKEKRDPKLATKLKTELAGIFNKAMAGRYRLIHQGQTHSPKIAAANAEYEVIENTAKAFVEDKGMVSDEHNAMPFGEVYSDYQKWCLDNAVDPMKKREFNGILGRKFGSVKRSSMFWKARYTKYREI